MLFANHGAIARNRHVRVLFAAIAVIAVVVATRVLLLVALAADLVLGGLFVGDVLLLLPLGASILEPDLHLRLGHVEQRGDLGSFARRQVLLRLELLLELEDLTTAEGGARLLLLLLARHRRRGRRCRRCNMTAKHA